MKEQDGQKEIRALLGIGTPVQKVLDRIGSLNGKLFQLSGGSNSGKSRTAFLFLEGLASSGLKCGFFDIEHSGLYSRLSHKRKISDKINVYSPVENDAFFAELTNAVCNDGVQAIVIDYINLIDGVELHVVGQKLKEFADKHKIFILAALHSRKTSDRMFESFMMYSDFSAHVSKAQASITLSIIKEPKKDDHVFSIVIE